MNRLRVEQLEPRDTPAVSPGGGELLLSSGVRVHPFGDWDGYYNTLEVGDLTYVGGTGGAGPRVATLNPDGSRFKPDYFAADPDSRFGVVFVAPEPLPDFDPASVGEGYTVFLDADRNLSIDTAAVVRAAAHYFAPVADVVRLTNVRPDLTPGSYLTFTVDGSGGTWFGPGVVGYSGVGTVDDPNSGLTPKANFGRGSPGGVINPEYMGAILAHEAGHAFGLQHDPDPRSIMYPTLNPPGAFLADELSVIRSAAVAGLSTISKGL